MNDFNITGLKLKYLIVTIKIINFNLLPDIKPCNFFVFSHCLYEFVFIYFMVLKFSFCNLSNKICLIQNSKKYYLDCHGDEHVYMYRWGPGIHTTGGISLPTT